MRKILTEKEILNYYENGWNFRIKAVKKYNYITRRKGQKEVSHGRYSKNRWEFIEKIKKSYARAQSQKTSTPKLFSNAIFLEIDHELSIARAMKKYNNCVHKDSEDFCEFWKWSEKLPVLDKLESLGLPIKKIEPFDSTEHQMWIHSTSIYICKDCWAFKTKNDTTNL